MNFQESYFPVSESMKSFVVVLVLCLAGIALADDSYWCDGAEKQETLTASLTALYLNTEETSWTHAHLWGSAECPCGWYGVDCVSDGNSTVRLYVFYCMFWLDYSLLTWLFVIEIWTGMVSMVT